MSTTDRECDDLLDEIAALRELREELLESLAKCRANFRRYEEATLKMAQAEDEERASLRTQRDELLTAMEKIATSVEIDTLRSAIECARAAIAKATT